MNYKVIKKREKIRNRIAEKYTKSYIPIKI